MSFNLRTRKKNIILILAMTFILVFACGCGKKDKGETKEEVKGTVVFQYGDNIVTKGEVYVYAMTIKERYETQYGEEVWELTPSQSEDETVTMEDVVREEVINEIIKIKTLVAHAEDYNVRLTEAKEAELDALATEFYEGLTDEDISTMEIDQEKILKVLRENTIATYVEEALLDDNPIEISDEKARMTTFYDMYFHCYSIDENGVIVPYNAEEKNIQYQNALQACSTLATANIDENEDAENIENLAEYYKLTQADEYTMTPENILETYGEEVYNMLYSMNNGDYSTVVETEYGYHVFQMIALTDKKATQSRKETMTDEAIETHLAETLGKWQNKIDPEFVYPESVDMDVYNTIKFN